MQNMNQLPPSLTQQMNPLKNKMSFINSNTEAEKPSFYPKSTKSQLSKPTAKTTMSNKENCPISNNQGSQSNQGSAFT
jgi:hypothetical protein